MPESDPSHLPNEVLQQATAALTDGRADEAIALLEGVSDRGFLGSGIAFDRGLAYYTRAKSGQGQPGDLGRAAHGFEEALRHDPNDAEAAAALEAVRLDIAGRDAQASGRIEEAGAPPFGRALLVSLPSDAWIGLALFGSVLLSVGLALRPKLVRGARLVSSTVASLGAVILVVFAALAFGARSLQHSLHEAVLIARVQVTPDETGAQPFELEEGARVDVLEVRASSARIAVERGRGWINRESMRELPAFRP